jgi:hypothetical protein
LLSSGLQEKRKQAKMKRISRLRPSPAIVVSFIALTAAVGGTAVAAPRPAPDSTLQAVTKSKVKTIAKNQANKAITQRAPTLEVLLAQTVADNAITTAKLADNAVTSAKIADNAVTSAKIAEAAVKAREFGPTQTVTNGAGLANATVGTVQVQCPTGTQVLNGGGTSTAAANVFVLRSFQSGNGWAITFQNNSGAAQTITAIATCLS